MSGYAICTRCVMDTSDPEIRFDENGVCNHCTRAAAIFARPPHSLPADEKARRLSALIAEVKRRGAKRRYDCVIGLSGGVDSSYVAYVVKKEMGLRPLAVHLDNGWDSELSVKNIENICTRLEIDLFTRVLDWEEFRGLQLAFLRASTPDSEIPSDHAIVASLYQAARRERVGFVLAGYNNASESILPSAWSQGHFDWRYIRGVNARHGSGPLRDFPHYGFLPFMRMVAGRDYIRGVRLVNILELMPYDKAAAKALVTGQLGWRDYGRKHGESNYTRIYQEHILPRKFGFDKRRAHLSSLIAAGQLSRAEALAELERPLYEDAGRIAEDVRYLVNKLRITREEFDQVMAAPPRTYHDYPNYPDSTAYRAIRRLYRLVGRRG